MRGWNLQRTIQVEAPEPVVDTDSPDYLKGLADGFRAGIVRATTALAPRWIAGQCFPQPHLCVVSTTSDSGAAASQCLRCDARVTWERN